ncbi:Nif11-like leader peptide family natural product precursor [Nostoc sp. CHAB 5824]|nr:Nif11-like leader peptide family natural product precursor [Nostoc sp. CHAB 5824]
MSKQDVVNLFKAASQNSDLLQKFNVRSLEELLFHAKNIGYNFSREELADVIGGMEATLILQKMGEKIDGRSSLWPKMWAKYHFHYIIEDVFLKFSEQELKQFV